MAAARHGLRRPQDNRDALLSRRQPTAIPWLPREAPRPAGRSARFASLRKIVTVALLLAQASLAEGGQVVVVLSGKESPYAVAGEEAQDALAREGHKVQVAQMDDLAKDPKAALAPGADLYFAVGSKAAAWLHEHVKPPSQLVYCMVADPENAGLTQGSPACGVSTDVPLESQMELIRQALPQAQVVGVLYRSDVPESARLVKRLEQAVPKAMRVAAVAVDKHPSPAAAIEALLEQRAHVIWTAADASVYDKATIQSLLLTSVRKKVPVFGYSPGFVKAGALLGIGIDPAAQGHQASALASRALRLKAGGPGAPPASGPATNPAMGGDAGHSVETPKFQVAVNLILAERLSITLPAAVVKKASIIIRPEGDSP